MPEEPNNRMEEMLRAYARERRKKPDVRMHPATRGMLQAEVARQYGQAGPAHTSFWKQMRAFWPQFAFGAGLCAIANTTRTTPNAN